MRQAHGAEVVGETACKGSTRVLASFMGDRVTVNPALGVREANSPVLASGCFHFASNKWGKNEEGSDTKLH